MRTDRTLHQQSPCTRIHLDPRQMSSTLTPQGVYMTFPNQNSPSRHLQTALGDDQAVAVPESGES